jgi:hypothetical protein
LLRLSSSAVSRRFVATTIVAVAPGPVDDGTGYSAYLRQFFTHVRVGGHTVEPYGFRNQQRGSHAYICTGPRQP